MSYQVGVDLGTTYSAAAVCRPGGPVELVPLGQRAHSVPSTVYIGPDGAFLRRGRLTAKAPPGAAFTVAMPGVVVTDAGECGLLRDEAGRAEVHAFSGKVGTDPAGQPTRWLERWCGRRGSPPHAWKRFRYE